jgi:lysophospholipase L1-like esterase
MRKKWLIFPPSIALVCVVLTVSVAQLVRRQYAGKLIAQIWPAGVTTTVLMADAAVPGTKTLLLLGDSRVADWGLPRIESFRVVNAGVPGMTSAQLVLRHREILDRVQPEVVVIQIGINDLKLLGVRPELRESVVSGCVSNIETIVTECRRRSTRVVLTTVWPAGRLTLARRFVWSGTVGQAVEETNAQLERTFANRAGVRVADIFSTLSREHPSGHDQLYRDTLHLRHESYARLSTLLSETIEAWTEESDRAEHPGMTNKPATLPSR